MKDLVFREDLLEIIELVIMMIFSISSSILYSSIGYATGPKKQ
jgi:hypothetical protein